MWTDLILTHIVVLKTFECIYIKLKCSFLRNKNIHYNNDKITFGTILFLKKIKLH